MKLLEIEQKYAHAKVELERVIRERDVLAEVFGTMPVAAIPRDSDWDKVREAAKLARKYSND